MYTLYFFGQEIEYVFLYTMPGYCYLTLGWDISIFHHPPSLRCACANVILPYPTIFYDNNNKKGSLNKLPQTTIIFRTRNVSIGHGCPHFRFFATESKSHNDYSG